MSKAKVEVDAEELTALRLAAKRYRTLMDMPGSRKRIWNHVLGDEQKKGKNFIEDVLDAEAAA